MHCPTSSLFSSLLFCLPQYQYLATPSSFALFGRYEVMRIGAGDCRTFFELECPQVYGLLDEVIPAKVLQDIKIRPHLVGPLVDRVGTFDDVAVDMPHTMVEGVLPVAIVLGRLELDVVAEPTSATLWEESLKMLHFHVLHPRPELVLLEGRIASIQPCEFAEQHHWSFVLVLADQLVNAGWVCH